VPLGVQKYTARKVEARMDLITIMLAGLLLIVAAARAKPQATEAADKDELTGPPGKPKSEPGDEPE